jgi:hypothetical protein
MLSPACGRSASDLFHTGKRPAGPWLQGAERDLARPAYELMRIGIRT